MCNPLPGAGRASLHARLRLRGSAAAATCAFEQFRGRAWRAFRRYHGCASQEVPCVGASLAMTQRARGPRKPAARDPGGAERGEAVAQGPDAGPRPPTLSGMPMQPGVPLRREAPLRFAARISGAVLWAALATPLSAGDVAVEGVLSLRGLAVEGQRSWLEGGFGRLGESGGGVGDALVTGRAQAHLGIAWQPSLAAAIDTSCSSRQGPSAAATRAARFWRGVVGRSGTGWSRRARRIRSRPCPRSAGWAHSPRSAKMGHGPSTNWTAGRAGTHAPDGSAWAFW